MYNTFFVPIELKPCPFCGATPVRQVEFRSGFRGIVKCLVCRTEKSVKRRDDLSYIDEDGVVELLQKATEEWNRRHV